MSCVQRMGLMASSGEGKRICGRQQLRNSQAVFLALREAAAAHPKNLVLAVCSRSLCGPPRHAELLQTRPFAGWANKKRARAGGSCAKVSW
jgi:hypothetical protein